MVAPHKTRRLVCTIVRVADRPQNSVSRFSPLRKPSALVPWADPYIAGLVRRLQSEVRMERAAGGALPSSRPGAEWTTFDNRGAAAWLNDSIVADLDPPNPFVDGDWDWDEQPRWTTDVEQGE